jgi:hypothetical protein
MANCTELIGFTADADTYCVQCAEDIYGADTDGREDGEGNPLGAIFGGSETDSPSHCAACGDLIPEDLTSYGVSYVEDAIREHIRAAVFVQSNGREFYTGRAGVVDAWREEYGDALDAKLCETYDAIRERQTAKLAVFLVTLDGFARKFGNDADGAAWTESEREDAELDDCAICGALISSGWLCLDGGDVVCDAHIVTPQMAQDIAADWHGGQTTALYALASSGAVLADAADATRRELRALDIPQTTKDAVGARSGYPMARSSLPLAERWRERDKLRALASYCDGARSRGYAEALLAVRAIVKTKDGELPPMDATAADWKLARIADALDEVGLH